MDKETVTLITQKLVQDMVIVAFLSLVANRLVEAICTPLFDRFKLDKFWLLYVSWAVGGALVYLSAVNIFASFIQYPMVGQILTSIVAGGGANLLHELFDALAGLQKQYNAKNLE